MAGVQWDIAFNINLEFNICGWMHLKKEAYKISAELGCCAHCRLFILTSLGQRKEASASRTLSFFLEFSGFS